MDNLQKAVLTVATGKLVYIQMAVSLARSFNRWHKNSNIKFILATDQIEAIPEDLDNIEILQLLPGQLGVGFSPKLHLDKLSNAKQTLFIDSDCLCVGSLEPVFERFSGKAVSVVGKTLSDGEFFGDIPSICRRFDLSYLPCFVGGLYYFEKGDESKKIYETARSLEPMYDEIGLIRLRGRENEEPLMAIAMAMYGQTPIQEDGSIKAEPMFYPSGIRIDVIKGYASLWNKKTHPAYCTTWGVTQANPLIVHFNCTYAERSPYTRECFKLEKIIEEDWNPLVASVYAFLRISLTQIALDSLKDTFRPLYRILFGVRSVKASNRLV